MSLAFVKENHRWPMNFSPKGPVTRQMFAFDDVIMILRWTNLNIEICLTTYTYFLKISSARQGLNGTLQIWSNTCATHLRGTLWLCDPSCLSTDVIKTSIANNEFVSHGFDRYIALLQLLSKTNSQIRFSSPFSWYWFWHSLANWDRHHDISTDFRWGYAIDWDV